MKNIYMATKIYIYGNENYIYGNEKYIYGNENTYTATKNINLLLAECEVRTASYGPSFSLPFTAQARSARAMKTRKEKTRIHNLPYGLSKRV